MNAKDPFQKFTAIAKAIDDEVYQVKQSESFEPFRRKVTFFECKETEIRPLIVKLDFIKNKERWGYPFRFGLLEILESDFNYIATKMLVNYE